MITTITNGKGGVGNTATATALAQWLSSSAKTLLPDFDPQGDATKSFGINNAPGVFDLIDGGDFKPVKTRIDLLDLLPGDGSTINLEATIYNRQRVTPNATTRTADKIRSVTANYNHVVIDTAKGGLLRESAVRAADLIIIPTALDYNSASNTLSMVEACYTWKREAAGIVVLPMFLDGRRRRVQSEAIQALCDGVENMATVYEHGIPTADAIEGAGWNGKTIFDYYECKKLAAAYVVFFEWLGGLK